MHVLILIHVLTAGGHLGRDKTSSRFYWEGMSNDIRNFIKSCDVYQRTNDAKFVKAGCELYPTPMKVEVWNMVNLVYACICTCIILSSINKIGKLPKTNNGNQYIITLMDYFSKWPEAEAVKLKSAETIAQFL